MLKFLFFTVLFSGSLFTCSGAASNERESREEINNRLCEMVGNPVELVGVVTWSEPFFHGERVYFVEVEGGAPEGTESYPTDSERVLMVRFAQDFNFVRELAAENSLGSIDVYGQWEGVIGQVHPECPTLQGADFGGYELFEIHGLRDYKVLR